jgi:serine O-acetyltransferase
VLFPILIMNRWHSGAARLNGKSLQEQELRAIPMSNDLQLKAGTPKKLAYFIARQLDALFPATSVAEDSAAVAGILENALQRMRPILASVRAFDAAVFDHFNSLQHASLIYLLSTEASRNGWTTLADRLFFLNKALAGLDLYHQVKLGDVFFISHGLGAVIGNAVYGSHIVFFQGVTVGRIGDNKPTVGSKVIFFPGCSVTGHSVIGSNCVHNLVVPDNSIVINSTTGTKIRPLEKDYLSLYFEA